MSPFFLFFHYHTDGRGFFLFFLCWAFLFKCDLATSPLQYIYIGQITAILIRGMVLNCAHVINHISSYPLSFDMLYSR